MGFIWGTPSLLAQAPLEYQSPSQVGRPHVQLAKCEWRRRVENLVCPRGSEVPGKPVASNYGLRSMDYGLLSMDYGLLSMDYVLLSMDYGLCSMDYGLL